MMKNTTTSLSSQLVVAAVFAALTIAALAFFVHYAEPPERTPGVKFKQDYDAAALLSRLTDAALRERLAQIQQASTPSGTREVGRLSGSAGCAATEALITDAFTQAGLTVYTQAVPVVVPKTQYCELLGADGQPIPGVQLYPLEPNGLVPTVLPEQGVSGKLQVLESGAPLDVQGQPLDGRIVLNHRMDGAWPMLASMGVKAVIYQESPLDKPGDADLAMPWANMLTPYDVDYPRFYLRGSLDAYAEQELTIRCKVTWETVTVNNVIGVMKGNGSTNEALVLNSYYDSYSVIPDLAPGAEQSLSLASMLTLLDAMAPYQGQTKRDVIFVASAGHCQSLSGAYKLLEAIETFSKEYSSYRSFDQQVADLTGSRGLLTYAKQGLDIVNSDAPWRADDNTAYQRTWNQHDARFRKYFEKQYAQVAGEINLKVREDYIAARLDWIRAGRPTFRDGFNVNTASEKDRSDKANYHETMTAYLDRKLVDTRAGNAIATPFWTLAKQLGPASGDLFTQWGYREALRQRFENLIAYHEAQLKSIEEARVLHTQVFNKYDNTLTVNLELYSGGATKPKDLSVLVGLPAPGTVVEPQSSQLRDALAEGVPQTSATNTDPVFQVTSWGPADANGGNGDGNIHSQLESQIWFKCGKLAYTIASKRFFPARIGTPEDTFDLISTDVLAEQLPIIGRGLLSVAQGRVTFKAIKPLANTNEFVYCKGTVLTKAGTTTIVPTHPMADRTFVKLYTTVAPTARAIRSFQLLPVDPYGYYEKKYYVIPAWSNVTADAARFDERGVLTYYKDASLASQGVSKNEAIGGALIAVGGGNSKEMNISLFRSSLVACYQRVNPKTLNAFPRFEFLSTTGLATPDALHIETAGPGISAYLPPDFNFYIAALDGSAANPAIQTYRGFLLNVQGLPAQYQPKEPEIFGKGYVAADASNITYPYFDGAASMLRTNGKRLVLQTTYHMADKQMLQSHALSKALLAEAITMKATDPFSAVNLAGKSFALAINNHPVIRNKISNAIFGILWYLFILVPFVFFMEKLLFGFTDIRKQLLAVGAIFIVVFLLLKQFHPAFQMVRAPEMILLGFIIFLLSLLVTMMVSGKFQQVIKTLRRKEGTVEGADVNRGGVIGTAFMLGLNNMRRRKVRTGLTCVTLILITFVMICFTSVSTDLQNVEFLTGRSPANGLIRRDPNFLPIAPSELNNLQQIYGLDYPVSVQYWLVGGANPALRKNAELNIVRTSEIVGNKVERRAVCNAAITLQPNEPIFSGVDQYLITKKKHPLLPDNHGWFPIPPDTKQALDAKLAEGYIQANYVILPDVLADKLDIKASDVENTDVTVMIKDVPYLVWGIFDSTRFDKHTGMDGQSMLPYDLNSMQNQSKAGAQQAGATTATAVQSKTVSTPQNIDRLRSSAVIITNVAPAVDIAKGEQNIAVFCSVLFPDKPYKLRSDLKERDPVTPGQQRAVIQEYLERLGIGAYYAINHVAYYGYRTRMKTVTGLIELLIPILIAAMTVFNTMRGSVYERKDEIYVYNAVGIAPNHVFFMFMAEACVYAVIGALAGYLLSQITGTALTALNLTGGLNMDYSSIETIYASIAIVASVLLSTLVPAHTASRLALPSDEVSWSIPKVDGDVLEFNLPFTFTPHDRIAVLSYFQRWLDANGEGSSGPFFCAPPHVILEKRDNEPNNHGLVPSIETTIWLKPYDLGVSQRLTIQLPTDPETGEYIARITIERLSGTMAAWTRALMPFLSTLRKQFLNWRAVSDTERSEMFDEAKTLLTASTEVERETVNA